MIQLNMDCEGPLTQNDNAFELCQEFIPNGGKFFSIVSKYDDFLADVIKKPGYKAGDTLRLVLPFLKAFGVTNNKMEEFSEKTLILLSGTEIMLPILNSFLPSFIISTSYKPYLEALCKLTSFPIENCFCTEVDIDSYQIEDSEVDRLRHWADEIAKMEMIEWKDDAKGIEDLEPKHQESVKRLDDIFWNELYDMEIGRLLKDIKPVGGVEKAISIEKSLERTGFSKSNVVFVGDSITDCQALDLVSKAGGVAISFNGNRYAIRNADYAILSENTCIIGGICGLLKSQGMDALKRFKKESNGRLHMDELLCEILKSDAPEAILKEIERCREKDELLEIYNIQGKKDESLIKKSEEVRRMVRGHRIGELG